jgi:hypothetical protein
MEIKDEEEEKKLKKINKNLISQQNCLKIKLIKKYQKFVDVRYLFIYQRNIQ